MTEDINDEEIKDEAINDEENFSDENDMEDESDSKERKEARIRAILIFIVGFLGGVIVCSIIGIAAYFIINKPNKDSLLDYVEASNVLDGESLGKLVLLEALINTFYYDDIDSEKLKDGLYDGIVSGLGDPYSCYYSAEQINDLQEDWNGNYIGIGVTLSLDNTSGYAIVENFQKGGSALESDMKVGDKLIAVDGENVFEMPLAEIVSKVKGEEGTYVTVTVENSEGRKDITLERRQITISSVELSDEGDGIYRITISEYAGNTYEQFAEAMEEVKNNEAEALIIDLRGNPGGEVNSVVDICNSILPEGDIVYIEDKNGEQTHLTSDGETPIDIPLVVLVDGMTASSAEIMTGAIKDYDLGTIVGTKTYGKGVVQNVIPLDDGSALRITVCKYFTPNGSDINHEGIEPDEVVPFDAKKYLDEGIDNQLEYAKDKLKKELGISDDVTSIDSIVQAS